MADQAVKRLVHIEDGLLITMSGSPQYVSQFPFLAGLQARAKTANSGGCSACSRNSAARSSAFNAAKAAIAGMDGDNKRKLKELLNAGEVRVRYTEGNKTYERTF